MAPKPVESAPEAGTVYEFVDRRIDDREDYAMRRQRGISNDKRLFVLACMDERLPVEEALGIGPGDAHVFRNAGGKVTDDVIRSVALTTNFFDVQEVIVLNHTDCGMMSASDEAVVDGLTDTAGGDVETVDLDPSLPALTIGDASLAEWVRMTDDVDEACRAQVEYLDGHPFVPDGVPVHGYVYEVESDALRRPGDRIAKRVNTRHDDSE
jgi:carbonic anhydrase